MQSTTTSNGCRHRHAGEQKPQPPPIYASRHRTELTRSFQSLPTYDTSCYHTAKPPLASGYLRSLDNGRKTYILSPHPVSVAVVVFKKPALGVADPEAAQAVAEVIVGEYEVHALDVW